MPARKARNGQLRDIAHPLNSETREEVETRVLEEFERAVKDLAVPGAADGPSGKKGRQSVLDRLSGRLFNEEFWIADATPQSNDRD